MAIVAPTPIVREDFSPGNLKISIWFLTAQTVADLTYEWAKRFLAHAWLYLCSEVKFTVAT